MDIEIHEYAPHLFAMIREQETFSYKIMLDSFAPNNNRTGMRNFQEGSGKSSSFFFFTDNKRFVIKTLKDSELKLLTKKGLLQKYAEHLASHPRSILTRFYGVYKIKIRYALSMLIIIGS